MPVDAPQGWLAPDRAGSSEVALSAVICTYNRYELLPEAIESLLRQGAPRGALEVIVVDNSPDPVRARRFGERYAGIARLSYLLESRAGLSNARNCGAMAARGRIVAYMDDDARAPPCWARELLRTHDAFGGRAGAVGGPVRPLWPCTKPEWLGQPLFGYLSIVDLGTEMRELRAGEWLAGCNISFDKAALAAVGGFRVDLGRVGESAALLSNEDLEVAERIRAAGKLIAYTPHAWVEHVIAPERLSEEWFRRRAAWQAVSDVLSNPDKAAALSESAARQLSLGGGGLGFLGTWRGGAAVKREMDRTYCLVILALCGDLGGRSKKPRWHERLLGGLQTAIRRYS